MSCEIGTIKSGAYDTKYPDIKFDINITEYGSGYLQLTSEHGYIHVTKRNLLQIVKKYDEFCKKRNDEEKTYKIAAEKLARERKLKKFKFIGEQT